jgi:glycosyltransferase involved in cell wall biosynthesis
VSAAPARPKLGPAVSLVECPTVRITVVVPTFNEADNLDALVHGVRAALPDASVLVVDDNSVDGTADLAVRLGCELGAVDVLRRPRKAGLGAAYRAGFRLAIDDGAEILVQMDADLSHDPATLPALVAIVEHGADAAIGSRYVPGGVTENWPWRRRALSRWGNRYVAGVLGLAVNDSTAGYRAYTADALRRMAFDTVRAEGYGFQVEMTYRIVRVGGKVVEFPITFRDRTAGESKMSGNIVSEALVLVLKLWVQDLRGRRLRRRAGG